MNECVGKEENKNLAIKTENQPRYTENNMFTVSVPASNYPARMGLSTFIALLLLSI